MWHHIALDIKRSGKLIGHLMFTVDVPEPQGIVSVGINLNENNTLVAVDPERRTLFVSAQIRSKVLAKNRLVTQDTDEQKSNILSLIKSTSF